MQRMTKRRCAMSALHDLRQILVDERLAAGDRHDRGAAFLGGVKRVLDRDALVQNLFRVIDLAAARACKVAAEERLKHQHERIAFAPSQVLADDVTPDLGDLPEWNSH